MSVKLSLCDTKAVRRTYLKVGDAVVGLQDVDIIAKTVRGLNLQQEEEIKRELLSRVKLVNYIPDSANAKYIEALWGYYSEINLIQK
ncbi:hypothetical protein [Desulfotomaculum sp. 1211_IL3151]|uniref:hypothetical protein n=1 Tax=Desulfotomaculum sp. 1211_IL3151 TaxID=3084055 RepID=UPI002FD899EF